MIEPGQTAPDFELPDQDGNPVRLSDAARRTRRPVLLPQGRHARAARPRPAASATTAPTTTPRRARSLGVSPDPVKAVKKFHDKQRLNFTLLADEDHAVCELYGVWVEKSMYGRTYWGAQRATFVIDERGRRAPRHPKASPKTHDDEVLAALGSLAAA